MSEAGMEGQAARLRKLKARHYCYCGVEILLSVLFVDLIRVPDTRLRRGAILAIAMAAPYGEFNNAFSAYSGDNIARGRITPRVENTAK